jgi:flagellar motor switch protein FliM
LSDLLALEDGDVIPLGTLVDGTLSVTVDGHEFARGALGTSGGTLAVRLTQIIRPRSAEAKHQRNDA